MGILAFYDVGEGVIAVLSVVGNAVVLVAILRNHFLHTPTNVFIGHLATADVIMGLLVCPISIISSLKLEMDFHSCILLNSVIVIIVNAESFMLLCITGERFAAIRYPFQYHEIIDIPRANYISLAAWAAGVLTGLIPMFGWNPGVENYEGKCKFVAVISYSYLVYFGVFFMFLVPMTLMSFVYLYIGRVVQRHLNESYDLHSRFKIKMKKRVRTTKSFEVLIVVFFVLKLPISLLNCMAFYDVIPWGPFTHLKLVLLSILLDRSNAMVNPFFYAAGTSKMKNAMFNVVLCRPSIYRHSLSTITPANRMAYDTDTSSRFTSDSTLSDHMRSPSQNIDTVPKFTNPQLSPSITRPSILKFTIPPPSLNIRSLHKPSILTSIETSTNTLGMVMPDTGRLSDQSTLAPYKIERRSTPDTYGPSSSPRNSTTTNQITRPSLGTDVN